MHSDASLFGSDFLLSVLDGRRVRGMEDYLMIAKTRVDPLGLLPVAWDRNYGYLPISEENQCNLD